MTEKGRLMLIKLWNENSKSEDSEVKERAIEMLFGAFDSPFEMMDYLKKHNIEYNG